MRLTHLFSRHRWRVVSAAYIPPTVRNWSYPTSLSASEKLAIFGFTEIVETCACGARRFATVYGDHSGLKLSAELKDLDDLMRRS